MAAAEFGGEGYGKEVKRSHSEIYGPSQDNKIR